jgi:hypothetical protein
VRGGVGDGRRLAGLAEVQDSLGSRSTKHYHFGLAGMYSDTYTISNLHPTRYFSLLAAVQFSKSQAAIASFRICNVHERRAPGQPYKQSRKKHSCTWRSARRLQYCLEDGFEMVYIPEYILAHVQSDDSSLSGRCTDSGTMVLLPEKACQASPQSMVTLKDSEACRSTRREGARRIIAPQNVRWKRTCFTLRGTLLHP